MGYGGQGFQQSPLAAAMHAAVHGAKDLSTQSQQVPKRCRSCCSLCCASARSPPLTTSRPGRTPRRPSKTPSRPRRLPSTGWHPTTWCAGLGQCWGWGCVVHGKGGQLPGAEFLYPPRPRRSICIVHNGMHEGKVMRRSTHTHTYTHTCTHAHTHACTHARTHGVHAQTHTPTHTHVHAHPFPPLPPTQPTPRARLRAWHPAYPQAFKKSGLSKQGTVDPRQAVSLAVHSEATIIAPHKFDDVSPLGLLSPQRAPQPQAPTEHRTQNRENSWCC